MVRTRVKEQSSESYKNANILLAGLIAAYAVIVCSLLQTRPLWVDEILQLVATKGRSLPQTLHPFPGHPGTAPLAYFVQSLFVNALGSSVFWARFPAAMFSVLSCAGIVWLARQLRWRETAVAAILFMTLPLQFRYALEGRCYSQALFFAVLATNAVLQVARRPAPFWTCVYGVAVLLGVYSLPLTAFVPLGHLVWIACCLDRPERKRALVWAGGAAAFAGLLFAPWYLWARSLWLEAIVVQQVHFVLTWKTPLMLLREMAGGGYWISVPLLMAAGLGLASRRMSGTVKMLLLSGIAAPVVGALIADAVFGYFLAIRQMIFMLPGLVLLAAEGLRELYDRRRGAGAVFFAGILAAALTYDVRWLSRPRENWHVAASILKTGAPESCILFVPAESIIFYAYFEPEIESLVCDPKRPFPPSRRIIVATPHDTPQAATEPILDRLHAAGMALAERKAAGGIQMLFYERIRTVPP
jgi:uncharacterized membrane protein